jgi:hypothetical protein
MLPAAVLPETEVEGALPEGVRSTFTGPVGVGGGEENVTFFPPSGDVVASCFLPPPVVFVEL